MSHTRPKTYSYPGSTNYSELDERALKPFEVGGLGDGEIVTLYKGAVAIGQATPHYDDYRKYFDKSRKRKNSRFFN